MKFGRFGLSRLIIAVICICFGIQVEEGAWVVEARRYNRLRDLSPEAKQEIERSIGILRSLWTGFEEELYGYNKKKLDSRCFDKESMNEVAELYWLFVDFTFENLFDASISLINLFYDDYVVCHYDKALSLFLEHCRKEPEMCEPKHLSEQWEPNVFRIISITTSLGDAFGENSVEDPKGLMEIMLQLGKDIC
mmetsp:Transcript_7066/g.11900  ORF Transcript_7066/g.11900 Transcript_7066/m.11900 type:complete len:193 (+) Transcript_7066:31-609(+)